MTEMNGDTDLSLGNMCGGENELQNLTQRSAMELANEERDVK